MFEHGFSFLVCNFLDDLVVRDVQLKPVIHFVRQDQIDSFSRFARLFTGREKDLKEIGRHRAETGVYVFSASVTGPKVPWYSVGSSSNQGRRRAALGAMGEAVERQALATSKAEVRSKSYLELTSERRRCLDPLSFRIFSDEQACVRQGSACNLSRLDLLDWSRFEDAHSGGSILVPNVFAKHDRRQTSIAFRVSTNGNACGLSPESAKLMGLLELIERDAVMLYWWTRNRPLRLRWWENSELSTLVAKFGFNRSDLSLYELDTGFTVKPILVVRRSERKPYVLVAGACRIDAFSSIRRALGELRQIELAYEERERRGEEPIFDTSFDRSVWDFTDHLLVYALAEKTSPARRAFDRVFHCSDRFSKDVGTEILDRRSDSEHLLMLLGDLARRGIRVYFKDISPKTAASAGLHVYRSFSPDLIAIDDMHYYRQLGFSRLFDLPMELGLERTPRAFAELNPFPHPFP